MSYLALYRKYRPSSFDKVKGQDHIVRTLTNQLESGRIGHAYLFCGTRGTGKTSVAKLFAKAVNCEAPVNGSPCGQCPVCRSIEAHTSTNVIEIDAASNNGVDNIRDIVDEVRYSPTEGKYKVYIIDEVHMLSTGAFNALLKTLEEPPSYVIFILATTEVHKLPITILSRCQRYDFKRIPVDTIADCLTDMLNAEGIEADERAVRYIAKAGDGSMRDAQSLLDQCIAFSLGQKLEYEKVLDILGTVDIEVFAELLRYIRKGSVDNCLRILDGLIMQGREMTRFVSDFAWYLRNLLVVKTTDRPESVLEFSQERMEMLIHEAGATDEEMIIRFIRVLSELSNNLRYATQKRLLVEVALIKLCKPETETDYNSLVNRVRVLEDALENGTLAKQPEKEEKTETPAKREPVKLRKPVSEDMRKIIASWTGIVAGAGAFLRNILINSYPSTDENDNLIIVCNTEFDREGAVSKEGYLKEIIAEKTGLDVRIIFKARNSASEDEDPDLCEILDKLQIQYTD